MKNLEDKFDDFFRQAGKDLCKQTININFDASAPYAFLLALLLVDALNGTTKIHSILTDEGKKQLSTICQDILNQVGNKTNFKNRSN